MKHGMWTTGSKTPIELIQKSTSFTLDGVADKSDVLRLFLKQRKMTHFQDNHRKYSMHLLVLKRISYLQK